MELFAAVPVIQSPTGVIMLRCFSSESHSCRAYLEIKPLEGLAPDTQGDVRLPGWGGIRYGRLPRRAGRQRRDLR